MEGVRKLEMFALFLMAFRNFGDTFKVELEKLSTLYLPYQYSPIDYEMDEHAAEAAAYDAEKKIVYSVGANNIHVINISDVTNMAVIHHTSIHNVEMTDVEFCGDYIFVSMEDLDNLEEGIVKVYKRYDEVNQTLQLVADITVGPMPDMILPTADCLKLVVAIEAEPYFYNRLEKIEDPLGAVTIIKFEDLSTGNYTMNVLNFSQFDDKLAGLEKEGARFVYRKEGNTFANDVEPEYIAFSSDETLAYICLQENNAIAIVDMVTEEIISVHGLGFKDWSQFEMDPSDKDGGINMQPWRVFGMYQPDAIKLITIGGVDYIVTANEGYSKGHSFYDEDEKIKDIVLSSIYESNATIRDELQMEENLGRLRITKENGYNSSTEAYDALYSFGGRSFSIWRADNMSLVYDSGSSICNRTAMLFPALFNMDVDKGDVALTETDTRSDNKVQITIAELEKGPEPESLAVAKFGNYTVIIVGNEQPGTLLLYSIDEREPAIEPKFEGMFHDIQRLDAKWEYLVGGHDVSMLDPEDMRYIPAEDSPNGKPLLVVSGDVSGTVTLLQMNVQLGAATGQTTISSSSNQASQTSTTVPLRQGNQENDLSLMSETAYLATVGSLAGALGLGITSVAMYTLSSRGCKSAAAVLPFRKRID